MVAGAAAVAVCIPVLGEARGLRATLESVGRLDYPRALLDVVVAVDGPDPALARTARDHGARCVTLLTPAGSYAARNRAIDALHRPDVVLFTDADAEVSPMWVRGHIRTLRDHDMSGGDVRFALADRPTPAAWVDAYRHLDQRHYVEDLAYAATVNLGVRAAVLERLRFDGDLRSGGDYDFCRRAGAAGYSIGFAEDAWVAHLPRSSTRAVLAKMDRTARGARRLHGTHDDVRHRRRPRRDPAGAARAAGASSGPWWELRVRTLDLACSLVFARHNPRVLTSRFAP